MLFDEMAEDRKMQSEAIGSMLERLQKAGADSKELEALILAHKDNQKTATVRRT